MSWVGRRKWWIAAAAALAAVLAGGITWLTWPSQKPAYSPPVRARQYVAFTACMLTGPAGLADTSTQAAWSGMEAASSATNAQVTYLSVPVGQADTVGVATPLANSLVQQGCGVVVAVGAPEVATVQAVAAQHASIRFVLVGAGSPAANVAVVPAAGVPGISSRVQAVVEGAVDGAFHPGVVP